MEKGSILVVGGAGYIGSHVTAELLRQGYNVIVFDNLSTGDIDNVDKRAEFIEGDILSSADVAPLFKLDFDAVFHFAALKAAGESMLEPEKYSLVNINGTMKLLTAASAKGVSNIIFSSSAAVYGEPLYTPVDENHHTEPANYYGYTKLVIERNLHWYSRLKGIKYAALRYFNAAGYHTDGIIKGLEKNPANLIPIIMEAAAGKREKLHIYGDDYPTPDGTCIRDYIHVQDLAEAHVAAYTYLQNNGKNLTVNLGTGKGASVLDVLNAAKKITGRDIPYEIVDRRRGDPPAVIASAKLAEKLIGWNPKYSDIETILKTTADLYLTA